MASIRDNRGGEVTAQLAENVVAAITPVRIR